MTADGEEELRSSARFGCPLRELVATEAAGGTALLLAALVNRAPTPIGWAQSAQARTFSMRPRGSSPTGFTDRRVTPAAL